MRRRRPGEAGSGSKAQLLSDRGSHSASAWAHPDDKGDKAKHQSRCPHTPSTVALEAPNWPVTRNSLSRSCRGTEPRAPQPVPSSFVPERQVSLAVPCLNRGNGTSGTTLGPNVWGRGLWRPAHSLPHAGGVVFPEPRTPPHHHTGHLPGHLSPQLKERAATSENRDHCSHREDVLGARRDRGSRGSPRCPVRLVGAAGVGPTL